MGAECLTVVATTTTEVAGLSEVARGVSSLFSMEARQVVLFWVETARATNRDTVGWPFWAVPQRSEFQMAVNAAESWVKKCKRRSGSLLTRLSKTETSMGRGRRAGLVREGGEWRRVMGWRCLLGEGPCLPTSSHGFWCHQDRGKSRWGCYQRRPPCLR